MKRYLIALGLVAGLSSACTLELPTEDDLLNSAIGKLQLDKDTALAYTELAMKQAAMATGSLKAQTEATEKPAAAAPQFRAMLAKAAKARGYEPAAVTVDECRTFSEMACTESGVCSFEEDYSACGSDYQGKITRKFEGNFEETYKVTVEFDEYQEKTTADPAYFAFNGSSILTGTLGVSSANLSMHSEGDSGAVFGGKAFTIQTSSDVTFTYLNGELSINGTQTGTVKESSQSTSVSITELKFSADCEGPISGEVKTLIDGKESLFVVTGCGQATLTVAGQANPVSTEEVAKTFSPDVGGRAGFTSIIEGTNASTLITGSWYREVWIDFYIETDVDGDGTFSGVGDTFSGGYGTLVIGDGSFTPTWNYLYENVWEFDSEMGGYIPQPVSEEYDITGQPITFKLSGNATLVLNGKTYTNLDGAGGGYAEPGYGDDPAPAMSDFALNGEWEYDNGTVSEYWSFWEDTAGYTWIYYTKTTDVDQDGFYYTDTDTGEWGYGQFTHTVDTFTPLWEYHTIDTFDQEGAVTNTQVLYDAWDGGNGGNLQIGDITAFEVTDNTATIGGVTFNKLTYEEPMF
jgi:hypothetical protein